MIVAGGKIWAERVSEYGREGDDDDSHWELDEQKIEFVDGGEGNSNGIRLGGRTRIDSVQKWEFGETRRGGRS